MVLLFVDLCWFYWSLVCCYSCCKLQLLASYDSLIFLSDYWLWVWLRVLGVLRVLVVLPSSLSLFYGTIGRFVLFRFASIGSFALRRHTTVGVQNHNKINRCWFFNPCKASWVNPKPPERWFRALRHLTFFGTVAGTSTPAQTPETSR